MPFKPIKNEKIYKMVVEQVKLLITNGDLAPGDRLPPERELATMLNVSRASVRQAISALEILGVIKIKQGEGTYISDDAPQEVLLESFSRILVREQIDPLEILETRRMVECFAARLCAERITPEYLKAMFELLEENQLRRQSDKSTSEMNRAFHMAIAVGTGNSGIIRVMEVVMQLIGENMWPVLKNNSHLKNPERLERHLQQHIEIYHAIAQRDGLQAEAKMKEHLDTIQSEFEADLAINKVSNGSFSEQF